jgi:hypothetical protein
MNHTRSRRRRAAVLAAALTCLLSLTATATTWTITALPDPSPPYESWGTPALNDAGEVVFLTWLLDGNQAIVALSAAGPRLIAQADDAPFVSFTGAGSFQLDNQPDLDNQGRVVYRAYTFDPQTWEYTGAAYLDDHGARTALTSEYGGAGPWLDWCNPSLAGDGTCGLVTWNAAWQVQALRVGVLPALSGILDTAGPIATIGTEVATAAGGVAAVLTSDEDNDQRLLRCAGGTTTLISSRLRDGYTNYYVDKSVNRHGQVAFRAQVAEWTEAILVGDGGGQPTVYAQTGETTFSRFQSPGIDDQGRVAFQAQLVDWRDAILTGPDPVADLVISEQTPLFGSVLSSLELGPSGVNAAGDIAFRYSLDDGRSGIAIARRAGGAAAPLPDAARLALGCAPNPLNPSTAITFTLKQETHARVAVYGLDGRELAVPAEHAFGAGRQTVTWDGRDARGRALPSGAYVVRVTTADEAASVKVQLVR